MVPTGRVDQSGMAHRFTQLTKLTQRNEPAANATAGADASISHKGRQAVLQRFSIRDTTNKRRPGSNASDDLEGSGHERRRFAVGNRRLGG